MVAVTIAGSRRRSASAGKHVAPTRSESPAPCHNCHSCSRRSSMSGVHLRRPRSLAVCVLVMLVLSLSGAGAATAALLEVSHWSGSNPIWMERDTPRLELDAPKSSGAGWRRVDSPAGITILVESVGLSGDVATDADNDFTRIQEGIAAAVVLGAGHHRAARRHLRLDRDLRQRRLGRRRLRHPHAGQRGGHHDHRRCARQRRDPGPGRAARRLLRGLPLRLGCHLSGVDDLQPRRARLRVDVRLLLHRRWRLGRRLRRSLDRRQPDRDPDRCQRAGRRQPRRELPERRHPPRLRR